MNRCDYCGGRCHGAHACQGHSDLLHIERAITSQARRTSTKTTRRAQTERKRNP